MSFLLNRSRGRLANTLELVVGNVDLTARRLTPFAPETAGRLDAEIARGRETGWDAPMFGGLGLRA